MLRWHFLSRTLYGRCGYFCSRLDCPSNAMFKTFMQIRPRFVGSFGVGARSHAVPGSCGVREVLVLFSFFQGKALPRKVHPRRDRGLGVPVLANEIKTEEDKCIGWSPDPSWHVASRDPSQVVTNPAPFRP